MFEVYCELHDESILEQILKFIWLIVLLFDQLEEKMVEEHERVVSIEHKSDGLMLMDNR